MSRIGTDGSHVPVFSTDERSVLIEELQFTLGQGPCYDASAQGSPVLISDLESEDTGVLARWPMFVDEAVSAGVRAIFAFPLGPGPVSLGTMDLYRSTPGPLGADELSRSLVTADVVGIALLDHDLIVDDPDESTWLRLSVHQAAGMVMMQVGTSVEDALLLLRATAYGEGRRLHDLATDVLERRRRFDDTDQEER